MLIRGLLYAFLPLFLIGLIMATFDGLSFGYNDEAIATHVDHCVLCEVFIFQIWV